MKLSRVSMALWLFVVLMACNLGTSPAPTAFPTSTIPVSAGKPQVSIVSVAPSGTVRVNQRVDVTVQITDTVGATRFQMTANGRVVKTLTSATSAGETNRTLVMDFTPNTQGVVTLVVTASRADGTQSDPAQTQVTVGGAATNTPLFSGGGSGSGGSGGPPTADPRLSPSDPTCRAHITTAVNLRSGPGTTFDRLVVLPALSVLPLTGRSADNQWWQVRYAATNQIGWISAGFSTLYGSCGTIPIVGTATNTPVVIPSNTPIVPTNTSAPTVTPGLPDLVVTSIVGANALVLSGGTVTQSYSITLTNTGSGPSGAFQARITSFPPTQTRELNASSLPAGGSISLNVDLTFTSANAYTINVQADSGGSVTEVSEVNNSGQLPVTVTNP